MAVNLFEIILFIGGLSATFGRSTSEKSMVKNERAGDHGVSGMHPTGLDRFPGSGSK